MAWIGLLVGAWLLVFFLAGVGARWAVADVATLTTAGWVVVLLAASLLASAATMALAAGRWRQEAPRRDADAMSASRRALRLGNGYAMLAAAFAFMAVLLVLVYRLMHTV